MKGLKIGKINRRIIGISIGIKSWKKLI